jgi:predicted 3-demethylubiquinone-9 3-methyltransferase (glyoxalase superfamily)
MQKITPFRWFDNNAEEAVKFLYLRFQKFKDRKDYPLFRGRAATRGNLHDRVLT